MYLLSSYRIAGTGHLYPRAREIEGAVAFRKLQRKLASASIEEFPAIERRWTMIFFAIDSRQKLA